MCWTNMVGFRLNVANFLTNFVQILPNFELFLFEEFLYE